jgi:hypothetical protein
MANNLQLQTGKLDLRSSGWQGSVEILPVIGRVVVN